MAVPTYEHGDLLACPYCAHPLCVCTKCGVLDGPHICANAGCGRAFLIETTRIARPIEDVPR